MESIHPRQVQIASRTDVGRVRAVNQDAYGEFENREGYRLLVVADGMGGHSGGETASRLAVEIVERVFEREFGEPDTLLTRALRAANDAVHRAGASDPALHGMGTTGVALLIGPRERAWVAHVGDSRAYRLRDGRLDQITEDHSWVRDAVRRGEINADEARKHPMKNVLLRSIGSLASVEIAARSLDLKSQDRFLLCSDGLWGEVDDRAIAEVLARESPSSAVARLVELANAHGGSDNVTVQIAALRSAQCESDAVPRADGPIRAPIPSGPGAPPRLRGAATRRPLLGELRRWPRPGVIAATLLAATALFWRICA